MELLLNMIWLAVATTLVFLWRTRWLPQLPGSSLRNRKRQSFVGLICVLALLFPAISLTDDLHPTEIALPDTKSVYAVAQAHDSTGPSPRSHSAPQGFAGAISVSRFRLALAPDDSLAGCAEVFTCSEPHCGQTSDRAPPSKS